ncbi:MAG: exo-alpha-sialidase, partial [Methylotenera sp.]
MRYFMIALSLLCSTFQVLAHEGLTEHQKSTLAISVAFDAGGNLWRAGTKDGFIQVDKSSDMGKSFSKPISVNLRPQKIG